jgi:hypothetical protein
MAPDEDNELPTALGLSGATAWEILCPVVVIVGGTAKLFGGESPPSGGGGARPAPPNRVGTALPPASVGELTGDDPTGSGTVPRGGVASGDAPAFVMA